MEKQIRDFKVNYSLDWTYGVEISQMKQDLEELEKLGATHVQIEPYTEYDCSYVSVDAIAKREETDEEMSERIKKQQLIEEDNKKRDLQQLEKLKAKYGGQ